MALHTEVPLLAFLRLMHLRVARPVAFFVDAGAAMIVVSTMVPPTDRRPLPTQIPG
jgi:hypothetical protein